MIWYDMSYNQLNIDFLHKMETEPEEIEYEVEDIVNEKYCFKFTRFIFK